MEFIGVILFWALIIIVGLMNGKNRAAKSGKAGAQARGMQAQAAQAKLHIPRESGLRDEPVVEASEGGEGASKLDDPECAGGSMPHAHVEGNGLLKDAECAGGSMPHAHVEGRGMLEDEDCGGGSMAHGHTEGVSRAAHARRMDAIDREASPEPEALGERMDARALRRAVVMAEVLGKPRALRGMRIGGGR